jgi:glycosyltransferase involved in cell wall biosynthesis
LERTCASIASQTFQDFEWIVIDGGSNAETLAMFDKYRDRIDVFVSERDRGIYDALNKGVRRASCDYVNFMNAGDMFANDGVLARMNDEIQSGDEIVYGYIYYTLNGKLQRTFRVPMDKIKKDPCYWISQGLPHQAMFFRRDLFEKHGFYDISMPVFSDWDLNIKFWNGGVRFRFVDLCVSHFDHTGVSSDYWSLKSIQDRYLIITRHFPEVADQWDFKHPLVSYIAYKAVRFLVLPFTSVRRKLRNKYTVLKLVHKYNILNKR